MTQISYDRPKISYTPQAVQGPKKIPEYKPQKYIRAVSLQPAESTEKKVLDTTADITAKTGVAVFLLGMGGAVFWAVNKLIKLKHRK